eukprot:COSAG01_NODE_60227_length_296_cov_0.253807_1_plen_51_part_10
MCRRVPRRARAWLRPGTSWAAPQIGAGALRYRLSDKSMWTESPDWLRFTYY